MENEIKEDIYDCTICSFPYDEKIKVPIILKCTHTFCNECIKKMLSMNNTKCPFCKTNSITKDTTINRSFLEAIKQLKEGNKKMEEMQNDKIKQENKSDNEWKKVIEAMTDKNLYDIDIMNNNQMEYCINHKDKLALSYDLHSNEFLCDICSTLNRDFDHHIKKIKPKDFKCLKELQLSICDVISFLNSKYDQNLENVKLKSHEVLFQTESTINELQDMIDYKISVLMQIKDTLVKTKNEYSKSLNALEKRINNWKDDVLNQYLYLYGGNNRNKNLLSLERILKSLSHDESKIELLERFENDVFKSLYINEFNSLIFSIKENNNEKSNPNNNIIENNKNQGDIYNFFKKIIESINIESNTNIKIINSKFLDTLHNGSSIENSYFKNVFEKSSDKIEELCVKNFEDILKKIVDYDFEENKNNHPIEEIY